MKTIFNEADKNELIQRIEKLTPESKALWGKMNAAQMLAHCAKGAQMPTGEVKTKNSPMQFLGRLLKNSTIRSEKPLGKNSPTALEIKVDDEKEFQTEKANFIAAITKLHNGGEKVIKAEKHPFFGKLTTDDWGLINYKHADHHLRQFGV